MNSKILFVLATLLISSCSGNNLFQPTQTATHTPTEISTQTSKPTRTPSPTKDPLAEYLPHLPQIPSGFEWRMAPDLNVVMLLPDGWFFSREKCPIVNFFGQAYIPKEEIEQVCISQENLEEVDKYSTGQAVLVYRNIDDPEIFATDILRYLMTSDGGEMFIYDSDQDLDSQGLASDLLNIHKTTEVIKAWDYGTDVYTVHHLRVEAEYPFETGSNKNKIIQYSTAVSKDTVFLMIFETPSDDWDETMENYGLVLDYLVILGIQ